MKERESKYMAAGIALKVVKDNITLGIPIGIPIGASIGYSMQKKNRGCQLIAASSHNSTNV